MLKITTHKKPGETVIELEGRLGGPWVKALEECWRTVSEGKQNDTLRVEMLSVTFVDEAGIGLLKKMVGEGADLIASGCLNQCIAKEIMQSVNRKGQGKRG